MTLTLVDKIADDDGDTITVEAEPGRVYLTVQPSDPESPSSGCVALGPDQRARFARAHAEAERIAGASDGS